MLRTIVTGLNCASIFALLHSLHTSNLCTKYCVLCIGRYIIKLCTMYCKFISYTQLNKME